MVWTADFMGTRGRINNGGQILTTQLFANGTNNHVNIITVSWDYQLAPRSDVKVKVDISYSRIENGTEKSFSTQVQKDKIRLQGIGKSAKIQGPNSIQQCCQQPVEYEVIDHENANVFNWKVPNVWTIVGNNNLRKITVIPNDLIVGNMECELKMSCVSDASYKSNLYQLVQRHVPSITLDNSNSVRNLDESQGAVNKYSNICANTTYTYKVVPVCGATSYTWQFPAGWGRLFTGQTPIWTTTSNSIQIRTSNNPQNGNLIVTANFANCTSISTSQSLTILESVPMPPIFSTGPDFTYYHCGKWNICPQAGGHVSVSHTSDTNDDISHFVWSITSPWYFETPTGPQQTLTVFRNKKLAGFISRQLTTY